MRQDMKKVLTERPRARGAYTYHDVRAIDRQTDHEDLPSHEGMRRPHIERKEFSDLLGPLKKFLRGCVGRPWNDVWSEICKAVGSGNTVDQHLRGHVFQEIEVNAWMDGDDVFAVRKYRSSRVPIDGLYVDPRDGVVRWIEPTPAKPIKTITVDGLSYKLGDDCVCYPHGYPAASRPFQYRYEPWQAGRHGPRYPLKVISERRAIHVDGLWYWAILAETPEPASMPYVKDGKELRRTVYFPRYCLIRGENVQTGRYYAGKIQMSARDLRRHRLLNTK